MSTSTWAAAAKPSGVLVSAGVSQPVQAANNTSNDAGGVPASERAVLRLIQAAARTPEEILTSAIELQMHGLLSNSTLVGLCRALGVSSELLPAAPGDLAGPVDKAVSDTLTMSTPTTQHVLAHVTKPMRAPSLGGLGTSTNNSRLGAEFVLLGQIGRGGMGSVFRARHRLDGREYAIKVVPYSARPGMPDRSALAAQRVMREVQALAALDHQNVCRYYHTWVETDWTDLSRRHMAPALRLANSWNSPASVRVEEEEGSRLEEESGGVSSSFDGPSEITSSEISASIQEWSAASGDSSSGGEADSLFDAMADSSSGSPGQAARPPPFELPSSAISASPSASTPPSSAAAADDDTGTDAGVIAAPAAAPPDSPPTDSPPFGPAGGSGVPWLNRHYSYRKVLIIQMELCQRFSLRDFLHTRRNEGSR
jgi:hypothetical protein